MKTRQEKTVDRNRNRRWTRDEKRENERETNKAALAINEHGVKKIIRRGLAWLSFETSAHPACKPVAYQVTKRPGLHDKKKLWTTDSKLKLPEEFPPLGVKGL